MHTALPLFSRCFRLFKYMTDRLSSTIRSPTPPHLRLTAQHLLRAARTHGGELCEATHEILTLPHYCSPAFICANFARTYSDGTRHLIGVICGPYGHNLRLNRWLPPRARIIAAERPLSLSAHGVYRQQEMRHRNNTRNNSN